MIAWLWKLIVGDFRQAPPHQHRYEIFKEFERTNAYGKVNAYMYVSRCKECGDLTETRITP